jgi:hypothetical protein
MRLGLGAAGAWAQTLVLAGFYSCLWLAIVATPSAAQAQKNDSAIAASARALFQEGVHFADQNQWSNAADRFERALALRPSPVIAYNLASALEHLGSLIKASELLRTIIASPDVDAALRKSAEESLAEITPRIARVTIHAEGWQAGDQITIDEQELLDAQLDVPVPIDPGVHVITAMRGKEQLDRQTIELPEQYSLELSLTLARAPEPREVAASAPLTAPSARTDADVQSQPSLTSRWWFWTGIGVIAAGAVVTALVVSSDGSNQDKGTTSAFDRAVIHVQVKP